MNADSNDQNLYLELLNLYNLYFNLFLLNCEKMEEEDNNINYDDLIDSPLKDRG